MKNLIIIFFVIAGIGFLTSCQKEAKDPKLDMNLTVKPVITNPEDGDAFVLKKENADSILTVFQWSPTQYNLTNLEDTKYILQMGIADSSFNKIATLVSTTETSYGLKVKDLNDKLTSWKMEPDIAYDLEFRIYSYVNSATSYTDIYSDVITLSLTPYADVITYPALYVPGAYQGWDPGSAPKIYDFEDDGIYVGYIVFPASSSSFEFKFTSDPDWDHTNYGDGGAGALNTDPGAGNLSVPEAGGYYFVVDVNNLTWTYTLENWSIIGEWLNWSDDIDMDWDAANQELVKTVAGIPAADNQRFKFRANHDWAINLGAANSPDDGTLKQDGSDIPIPNGGTITFHLIFTTPQPTYKLDMK